jgi:hypothetical protein
MGWSLAVVTGGRTAEKCAWFMVGDMIYSHPFFDNPVAGRG